MENKNLNDKINMLLILILALMIKVTFLDYDHEIKTINIKNKCDSILQWTNNKYAPYRFDPPKVGRFYEGSNNTITVATLDSVGGIKVYNKKGRVIFKGNTNDTIVSDTLYGYGVFSVVSTKHGMKLYDENVIDTVNNPRLNYSVKINNVTYSKNAK